MFTINADFWAGAQAFVIAITAWLIYQQVKIQTKQAEIQTASHIIETLGIIHSRWNSESMIRSRMNICNAYLHNKLPIMNGSAHQVGEFLEELGVHISLLEMPEQVIWETYSWYIEHYFLMMFDGINQYRITYNDKSIYNNAEDLFKLMRQIEKEGEYSLVGGSEEHLKRFAEEEVQLSSVFLGIEQI